MGYEGENIYRVWFPNFDKVVRSTNVTFNETTFFKPAPLQDTEVAVQYDVPAFAQLSERQLTYPRQPQQPPAGQRPVTAVSSAQVQQPTTPVTRPVLRPENGITKAPQSPTLGSAVVPADSPTRYHMANLPSMTLEEAGGVPLGGAGADPQGQQSQEQDMPPEIPRQELALEPLRSARRYRTMS